jgi:hypothetical protein
MKRTNDEIEEIHTNCRPRFDVYCNFFLGKDFRNSREKFKKQLLTRKIARWRI